jgi:hypothetical protein
MGGHPRVEQISSFTEQKEGEKDDCRMVGMVGGWLEDGLEDGMRIVRGWLEDGWRMVGMVGMAGGWLEDSLRIVGGWLEDGCRMVGGWLEDVWGMV